MAKGSSEITYNANENNIFVYLSVNGISFALLCCISRWLGNLVCCKQSKNSKRDIDGHNTLGNYISTLDQMFV